MITITFASWTIPAIITVICLIWVMYVVGNGSNFLYGLRNILIAVPYLFIIGMVWILWGIFS